MSWDASLPSNTTKMRQYPEVLTNNFAQIEQGADNGGVISLAHWQVNFVDRQTVPGAPPPAVNPTQTADTIILFSKTDTNAEAYIMDDQGIIMQLTQDGNIGSTATPFAMSQISFDTTLSYNQANMVTAKGSVNGVTGVGSGLFNCTSAGGAGQYTITFTNAMSNLNYQVNATAQMSGSNHQRVACWRNKTLNDVQITIRRTDQSGSFQAENFDFVIIGGR